MEGWGKRGGGGEWYGKMGEDSVETGSQSRLRRREGDSVNRKHSPLLSDLWFCSLSIPYPPTTPLPLFPRRQEYLLWADQLPAATVVMLAGADQIVPSPEIRK